jgi:hypothetical protein
MGEIDKFQDTLKVKLQELEKQVIEKFEKTIQKAQ